MPMMFHSEENASESQARSRNTAQMPAPAQAQSETQAQSFAPPHPPAQQERRYDPDTLRRMTEVATRLQHDHNERLTAGEMESIGAEVGLKPEFVQQALAQLDAEKALAQARAEQEQQRQAQQHTLPQRKLGQQAATHATLRQSQASGTRAEFYSVCAALSAPLLFGLLAYYFKSGAFYDVNVNHTVLSPRTGAIQLFTLIAPVPLALLQGFAAGKRRVGFMAAAALIFALAPTVPFLAAASPEQYQQILTDILSHLPEMMAFVLFGVPIAGAFGAMGAWMRQHYFPFAGDKARDAAHAARHNGQRDMQPGMQSGMQPSAQQHGPYGAPADVQHREYPIAYANATGPQAAPFSPSATQPMSQQIQPSMTPLMQPAAATRLTPGAYTHAYLPYQNQPPTSHAVHAAGPRRAYLSVDVAGLDNLRQSATLAAVDYSFGQLRAWTEEIVRVCGGDVHHDAAAGLLASFPADAQAARAARLMQERLGEFNHALNRLPVPFRLRCGLSAGEAGDDAARERSQSLLQTAQAGDTLVSSEMGAAALSELGTLMPLSGTAAWGDAFVWRPGRTDAPTD